VDEHGNVFAHVGFSFASVGWPQRRNAMDEGKLSMAQQVARAAGAYQQQRTGRAPKAVTVVLSGDTLVITLQDALTPAEQELARSPAGAAQVQEFHRQLFADSVAPLRQDIRRITGINVREAASEVDTTTGTVVHAFSNGTMVQVFLLAKGMSQIAWNGDRPRAVSEQEVPV
jgi:uncharacterized protein YbcI